MIYVVTWKYKSENNYRSITLEMLKHAEKFTDSMMLITDNIRLTNTLGHIYYPVGLNQY